MMYTMGDSIFKKIGRAAGGIVRAGIGIATRALPGGALVSSVAAPLLSSTRGRPRGRPEPGLSGAIHRLAPGGKTGYIGGKRMNTANVKAARRAIRRIKGLRKLLQNVERMLPRRPSKTGGGSRGVITRAEALRALRH